MIERIVAAACLLIALAVHVSAQPQATSGKANENDVKRLLKANGAGEIGVETLRLAVPEMRAHFEGLLTSLSDDKKRRALEIMEQELFKVFTVERVVEELVPIYSKYLTGEEVKDLIAFYESPAGKKFVMVQPQLIREAGAFGEKLGGEGIKRIQQRMREEGLFSTAPLRVRPVPQEQ